MTTHYLIGVSLENVAARVAEGYSVWRWHYVLSAGWVADMERHG